MEELRTGDVVIYKDGGEYALNGEKISIDWLPHPDNIIEIRRPTVFKTIFKNISILTDKEKKWLGAFINPFKDKIEYISKNWSAVTDQCYIHISLKDQAGFDLPAFEKNSIYKGMEINKGYNLEELEL